MTLKPALLTLLVFVGGLRSEAVAGPIQLFLPGTVLPGGSFEITFRFDAPPVNAGGPADVLVINGGSVSSGLLFSWVDLYADNVLLSSYQGMTNSFGVFTQDGSTFSGWSNPTHLSPIWAGANARIIFRPVFDLAVQNAHIQYQVNWLYASRATGVLTHDDEYGSPAILGTQVNVAPVPEPTSLALLLSGISVMVLQHRWRRPPPIG